MFIIIIILKILFLVVFIIIPNIVYFTVKVSAKYLAWRIPNREKPKLDEFYLSLAESSTKLRSLKQRAVKEASSGTNREICEVFIMNWANQRPKSENKVSLECQDWLRHQIWKVMYKLCFHWQSRKVVLKTIHSM